MKDIITLAVESSCDETSVAVLKNGREVLSNIINTQVDLHKKFGGVVPEVASRKHIENIDVVLQEALDKANIALNDIDHIAVTYGPGLVGALLVGLSHAKALAFTLNKPLVGVNHIEGHVSANYIEHKDLKPPFITLIAGASIVKALNIMICPKGIDLGQRRITVSTCGLVSKIKEFANLNTQVNLAISLHAPNQKLRESLMPIAKAYPLDKLMEAVDYYIDKTNRRVTMEYILLENVNDSIENAKELASLLKGKLVYVNLIPYNTTSSDFKRSSKERINAFFDVLVKNGINTQKRREMGKDIKGACGQLKASYERDDKNV